MQNNITLDESEWILTDAKLRIWYHKDNPYIIKQNQNVYDLKAINFYYKLPNNTILETSSIPSKFKYKKIKKFSYTPLTKNIYLNPHKEYSEKDIINLCKFGVNLDYEYLGQDEIKIDKIIELCHTEK